MAVFSLGKFYSSLYCLKQSWCPMEPLAWTWFSDSCAKWKPTCVHWAATAMQNPKCRCLLYSVGITQVFLIVIATISLDELCFIFTGSWSRANDNCYTTWKTIDWHCIKDFWLLPKVDPIFLQWGEQHCTGCGPIDSLQINYIRPLDPSQGYGWYLTDVDTFWFMELLFQSD